MASILNDFYLPEKLAPFCYDKHVAYVIGLYKNSETLPEYALLEYLKINAIVWTVISLILLNQEEVIEVQNIIDFVNSCANDDGGYGPAAGGFDSNLVTTLSALQLMILLNRFDLVDVDKMSTYVASLQNPDGSFIGDIYGEKDTRHLYCAVSILFYLDKLDLINTEKTVEYLLKCMNNDGGFGVCLDAESHGGQVFCCIASLGILNALHRINVNKTGSWLCERQLCSGGFNGRPEKLPDCCYAWWIYSPLKILRFQNWISSKNLLQYVLECQDQDMGGFTDHPGNESDIYHTHYTLCALSLMNYKPGLIKPVHPLFCMPMSVIELHFSEKSAFFAETFINKYKT